MQAAITKQQLKQIGPHYGSIDTDSGKLFIGFAGALDLSDGLYHGELRFRDDFFDEELPRFSLSAALGGTPLTDDREESSSG